MIARTRAVEPEITEPPLDVCEELGRLSNALDLSVHAKILDRNVLLYVVYGQSASDRVSELPKAFTSTGLHPPTA